MCSPHSAVFSIYFLHSSFTWSFSTNTFPFASFTQFTPTTSCLDFAICFATLMLTCTTLGISHYNQPIAHAQSCAIGGARSNDCRAIGWVLHDLPTDAILGDPSEVQCAQIGQNVHNIYSHSKMFFFLLCVSLVHQQHTPAAHMTTVKFALHLHLVHQQNNSYSRAYQLKMQCTLPSQCPNNEWAKLICSMWQCGVRPRFLLQLMSLHRCRATNVQR